MNIEMKSTNAIIALYILLVDAAICMNSLSLSDCIITVAVYLCISTDGMFRRIGNIDYRRIVIPILLYI